MNTSYEDPLWTKTDYDKFWMYQRGKLKHMEPGIVFGTNAKLHEGFSMGATVSYKYRRDFSAVPPLTVHPLFPDFSKDVPELNYLETTEFTDIKK